MISFSSFYNKRYNIIVYDVYINVILYNTPKSVPKLSILILRCLLYDFLQISDQLYPSKDFDNVIF